ncbi:hypothetical protein [Lacticaseibacillus sharpeae]|uniref:Uncharacterized protein n=1 Tax=Lacticaseibacillus sharpeae JCM 1186 = DSM 20505 TaxID=1291052 RepID=A0A0R1ZKH9_9LACO|nr:hypothetical protein [Lacticaseibacillus sharpeae]KRM55470.1 hypothetical protein FC18_GL001366 [Lacticaseibacillus sharpeae JCM 1186 = DSM 20505]
MKKILFATIALISITMSSASVTVGATTNSATVKSAVKVNSEEFVRIAEVSGGPGKGVVEIPYVSTISLDGDTVDQYGYYYYLVDGNRVSAHDYI